MIHWKQQLHLTQAICKLSKRVFKVFLVCCLLPLTSCFNQEKETMTLSEWIHELDEAAGITIYNETNPYFINVSQEDSCYEDVQAAVEWQVLDPSYGFEPNKTLTREWVAYTLMNLANKQQDESLNIKDISNSTFKSQIQSAVSSGLMKVDKRNMFHPEETIDKNEALDLLNKTVSFINNREITETKTDIEWNTEAPIEVVPTWFNEGNLMIGVEDSSIYQPGDIITFNDGLNEQYYEVESIIDDSLQLKEIDLLETTDSMDLSGSSEMDFSNATIIDGSGEVLQETSYTNHLENMSTRAYQKSFNISDFKVTISAYKSGVKAEVSRTLPLGASAYASLKVSGVKCDYEWKSEDKSVNDAYFKVNFHSEENIGLKNGAYKNLYGDFSEYNADQFISSLTSMFKEKKDVVESSLTLCQIKVPIPNAPLLNLTMSLELHMYISGKIEVVLSQDSTVGCEVRDGNVRMIKEMSHTETNRFKATAEARAGILFGLNLVSLRLMDVGINASAKASLKTQLHLYKDAEHRIIETDVSTDVASELSDDNPNVLVCSDINANLTLYLKINSSKSQLGKFGISGRVDLLKKSLVPSGKTHMENFMFVTKCTRKDRVTLEETESITVSKKIKLQDYSMIVRIGKNRNIVITGLPEGYSENDLVYESDNTNIATVDSNGNVTGLQAGSAVITVKTNDGSHYIKCNILVPEGKS